MKSDTKLKDIAVILRRDSMMMTTKAGSGHPTTCMSCADIMSVLFFDEMRYDAKNPNNPNNDEFIMSKGHAAPILYSCLKHAGCIHSDLLSLRKLGSSLEGHPVPSSLPWIKVATGSLGQGLSNGLG
ncbi:MAG: transketolase, partial [Candidatus Nanoarchaeia archaeon]